MADITELILADHLQITRWAARLGELYHRGRGRDARAELAATWETLAALTDLHMRADEQICGPAVVGDGADGRAMTRQIRDDHDNIREIIRETSLQPPGSLPWWHLARTALSAWAAQLDREQHGPQAECRFRADPALREQLARQWRAFADAHIRDQYPQAPPQIPTHRLRQDSRAPVTVPRLDDPRFGPLACTCRACTRTLEWVLFRPRKHVPERPMTAG